MSGLVWRNCCLLSLLHFCFVLVSWNWLAVVLKVEISEYSKKKAKKFEILLLVFLLPPIICIVWALTKGPPLSHMCVCMYCLFFIFLFNFGFYLFYEIRLREAQANLECAMQLKMILNSWFYSIHFSSVRSTKNTIGYCPILFFIWNAVPENKTKQ